MPNSFNISDLPEPIAALLNEILKGKVIQLQEGETGVIRAHGSDEVIVAGPQAQHILELIQDVIAYNPPDEGEPEPPEPEPEPDTEPCGLNVDEPSDWGSCLVFADRMKHARTWRLGNSWDAASGIPLDENGYPTVIPSGGKTVHTLLTRDLVTYPAGRYVCLYEGQGDIAFDYDARVVSSKPGRIEFDVTPSTDGIHMTINQSTQGNHVRNIRVLSPGCTEQDRFYPDFLEKLGRVGVLRFMDWGAINGCGITSWSGRATPGYYTQNSERGCAVEYMLELAKQLGADPWICIPHKADDGYIRELGKLIASKLPQGRKVFIEYSNEIWNSQFPQYNWCADQGVAKGFHQKGDHQGSSSDAGVRLWCAIKYQAYRSGHAFKLLLENLRADQMVTVLAGHAADTEKCRVLFRSFEDPSINDAGGTANAMAIAPYFGGSIKGTDKNAILDACDSAVYSQTASYTHAHASLADSFGVPLIAYEGGQHLYGSSSAEQNAMRDANRDPRMGSIYSKMFRAWHDNGGRLFVNFSFCWRPSSSGYWGLLERLDQSSPKWDAFQAYVTQLAAAPLGQPPRPDRPPRPRKSEKD